VPAYRTIRGTRRATRSTNPSSKNKKIEWDDERRHITDYKLKRYLPTL
jgi:hypothetical protein